MARLEADSVRRWVGYIDQWMTKLDMSNADLGRATGIGDSQISKYRRGASRPDIPTCRLIADAMGRPRLEVIVAAGHLEPDEVRIRRPSPPPKPSAAEARIRRLTSYLDSLPADDPKRRLLESLLDATEIVADIRQRDVG